MSPEHNDLLLRALPPLVLLQADVTVVLPRVQPPVDGSTQVCQGPVEVVVQQTGGRFQESLKATINKPTGNTQIRITMAKLVITL